MRLGEFILRDMEQILSRWETFAATCLPASDRMSMRALRDHGPQILKAIVTDLGEPQTADEQSAKSRGLEFTAANAPETAAQTHAVLRAKSGFNIEQLASEYRALRASVLSLWIDACLPGSPPINDMIRFNEAIDQALAESISYFSIHVTRSRNLLLGMLSHDLRSPLQTIQVTAKYLQQLDLNEDVGKAARRLINGGARMQMLVTDLIDFTRTELGLGLSFSPSDIDLGVVCAEELDQVRAAHSDRTLELKVVADCRGWWDPGRMQQLLNNLVVNAIHYGEIDRKVSVLVDGSQSDVRLLVANTGKPIDDELLAYIFEPLRRGSDESFANNAGLGLGLYIASEIAKAHAGKITATSAGGQTVFTVTLPRRPPTLP